MRVFSSWSQKKRKKRKQITCRCDGYWFPHRKTGGYCNYNPNLQEFMKEHGHRIIPSYTPISP